MAGSVTVSYANHAVQRSRNDTLRILVFSWVGDASTGSVPDTAVISRYTNLLRGWYCVLAGTVPGSGTAPSSNYDIQILDTYGIDIMGGQLSDRSATESQQARPQLCVNDYGPRPIAGELTFSLSGNSVASATGTCVLFFEKTRQG